MENFEFRPETVDFINSFIYDIIFKDSIDKYKTNKEFESIPDDQKQLIYSFSDFINLTKEIINTLPHENMNYSYIYYKTNSMKIYYQFENVYSFDVKIYKKENQSNPSVLVNLESVYDTYSEFYNVELVKNMIGKILDICFKNDIMFEITG